MLNAKLLVVGGEVKTTEIKLRLPCVIGRGKGSTVILPHPLVSRQHCELFESNGRLWVRDLGSLNGTYVNNEKISETELPPNELLTIGTVTFRAIYEPVLDNGTVTDQAGLRTSHRDFTADASASTVRVDSPVPAESAGLVEGVTSLGASVSRIEQEALDSDDLSLDDSDGLPSSPLYSTGSPGVGGEQAPVPVLPPHLYPGAPAIPMAVTPNAVHAPPPQEPDEPIEEQAAASDDEDLNDFLNSLKKK